MRKILIFAALFLIAGAGNTAETDSTETYLIEYVVLDDMGSCFFGIPNGKFFPRISDGPDTTYEIPCLHHIKEGDHVVLSAPLSATDPAQIRMMTKVGKEIDDPDYSCKVHWYRYDREQEE